MNKKKFISSNILVILLTFLLYFVTGISVFFNMRGDVISRTDSFSDEVVSSLRSSSDFDVTMDKFRDTSWVRISYFSAGGDVPTKDSLGSYGKDTSYSLISSKANSVYFETSSVLNRPFCYKVTYLGDFGTYVRVGTMVPSSLSVSMYLLIFGSLFFLLVDGLYLFFSYRAFSRNLLALKSQIKKLQAITNSERPIEYDDDMQFLTLMIRDTRKELDEQFKDAKTSEQKINFILDSFSQGLVVVDASCRVVMINKKASEIFGKSKTEAEGRDLTILGNVGKVEKNLSMVVKTLIPMVYYETINGRIYECDINQIDYPWTRVNEKSGASMLLIDVTENFNSQKMKRDFFANASHELKSPLTSILGYQEMIRDRIITTPAEYEDAVAKTIKEANRMKKIILDMLELSSLENEDLRPIENINASMEIDGILSNLELELKSKHIHVNFKKSNLIVGINPDDFDKLMGNLLENAIKYNIDGGKIIITVDAKKKAISVRDTGIGISEENRTRIFERFFRVDKARSRENGGTGLGLAIVKYICNYYDFRIELESKLGEGSVFTVFVK